MAEFVNVGRLADFPTGQIKGVRVNGKSVAVVQVGGRVHAYANFCPHAGFTLSGGMATEEQVICDVHGAYFDIDSGQPVEGPAEEPLVLYNVRVEGEDVLVAEAS